MKIVLCVYGNYLNDFLSFLIREFRNDFLELLRRRFGKHFMYYAQKLSGL